MDILKRWWLLAILGAAVAVGVLMLISQNAAAADLGGNCCADLEERIAELEATATRKGNRKVTLRVYGTVNKALLYSDIGDESDTAVIENSAAESFVGFAGEARISPTLKAGYVLEVGVGGYGEGFDLGSADEANDIYLRRSFVYVDGSVGKVSLGLASQATDGIAELTVANTGVAARMLSLRPLNGPQTGEALDIFDGSRANVLRYDSPVFAGAFLSASWANGSEEFTGADDDVWDVALRWAGQGGGFEALAGVGYRNGVVVPTVGNFATLFDQELTVLSASASVKHTDTGLFLSAAAGKFDADAFGEVVAYHGQGGIERNWTGLGATTLYAEYANSDDLNLDIMGLGVVQEINAAAMDLYLTGRRIDIDGEEADTLMLGARVQF